MNQESFITTVEGIERLYEKPIKSHRTEKTITVEEICSICRARQFIKRKRPQKPATAALP